MSLLAEIESKTPVEDQIPRDRWGRPQVKTPSGEMKSYTRCTTYVSALEDRFGLEKWSERMVMRGLVNRPDLRMSVTAHWDDDKELNKIAVQAKDAAQAGVAATTGTAVHKLTEMLDAGMEIPDGLEESPRRDVLAYQQATKGLEVLSVEQFVVVDSIEVAGTFDRLVHYNGKNYIADIKTGSVQYGAGKMAMQLGVYSRGMAYDYVSKERSDLGEVDQNNGIIIHLPAGKAECTLYWINIGAGWEAVDLATKVRAWRKRTDLMHQFTAKA